MGAIAFHSGGLLVDHGWLRVLGAGHPRIGGGLIEWNAGLGGRPLEPALEAALPVAYDAVGGFFAINAGRWDGEPGAIHYLAPDTGGWEDLGLGYSGLLAWAFSEQRDRFYSEREWPGWEAEVSALGADEALTFYPPLGFEGPPLSERQRRAVPARELWTLAHEIARQLGDVPGGASVSIRVQDRPT